jgi:DNA-binding GntR family transcriptional regulator
MVKLPRVNLSEAAYSAVKSVLLGGKYSPGARVAVEELARELEVSRTPIWDALNRLEAEGMVEIIPRKGVYLMAFSVEKAREVYIAREALEGMASRLAAEQLTERHIKLLKKSLDEQGSCLDKQDVEGYAIATIDFHNIIVDAAGNKTLDRLLTSVYSQIEILRLRTLYLPQRLRASLAEHHRIFEALVERDPASSEKEARKHIRTTTSDALNILARQLEDAEHGDDHALGSRRRPHIMRYNVPSVSSPPTDTAGRQRRADRAATRQPRSSRAVSS